MFKGLASIRRASLAAILFSASAHCFWLADDCHGQDLHCSELALLSYVPLVNRYFAYVAVGTSTEAFSLNTTTGVLTPLTGSPFPNTLNGFTTPNGRFMYSAAFVAAPDNIRSYAIDAVSGRLTPTPTPLASANNQPVYADFTPDGRFVYFMNNTSLDVSAFAIDPINGNLSKLGDFPTSCACANLAQVRVTPNGRFFYVVGNGGPQTITQFSIDQESGNLTLIGNLNTGVVGMDAVIADPQSRYLYVVNSGGSILGFSIDQASGVLSALPGSPFAGTANNFRGAMHPSGRFLYAVNIGGATLSKHDIAEDGSLSTPSTLGFGTNLQYVTIDPTGNFGFVNSGVSNNYYVFSINSDSGEASLIPGNPFSASGVPGFFTVAQTLSFL